MKMSRNVLLVAVLLLILPVSFAFSDVKIESRVDHIVFGEKAVFELTLTNTRETAQKYEIFSLGSGIEWSVETKPLKDRIVTLSPGATLKTEVIVQPIEKFPAGVYILTLNIQSNAGETYEKQLKVYMGPVLPGEYAPSIRPFIDVSERIDPRETQQVHIFAENLNPRDLTTMTVRVVSEIQEIKREVAFPLEPSSQKTVDFSFKLNDLQQPKEYFIFFQFEHGGEIVKVVDKKIEVLPIQSNFTMQSEEEKSFLKTKKILTFRNSGNVRNTQEMSMETTILKSMFTDAQPPVTVKRGEKRLLVWNIELGPGESITTTTTVSYRMPAAFFILILVGFILYLLYRNPLIITKSASNVIVREGGVSALKVIVVIRNLSNNTLKDIEITDQVPSIAAVEKDVEMGTLRPTQILRGKQGGIFVKWKLSELEGKEERHITYKIKSSLNIIGTLELPRTKAIFTAAPGKKKVSYSNTYRINTGE